MKPKVIIALIIAVALIVGGAVMIVVGNNQKNSEQLPEKYHVEITSEPEGLSVRYGDYDISAADVFRKYDDKFEIHGSDYLPEKDGSDWVMKNKNSGERYKVVVDCGGISYETDSHDGQLDITFKANTVKCSNVTISFTKLA